MPVRQEIVAALACAGLAGALSVLGVLTADPFARREIMIPMRDGVRLQTAVFTPLGHAGPLPILLTRTPYGVPVEGALRRRRMALDEDGYILVFQNVRGRYRSEGEFAMQRPPHDPTDLAGTDETTDAYDTVDWLVKNLERSSGQVGILGTSYAGFLAAAALAAPHPALACASERAAMDDLFVNDDFHHNGALRLSYAFEYTASLETSKEGYDFPFDAPDLYDWYLRLGALPHVDERYFHGKIPTWRNLVAHPDHDAFWAARAPSTYLTRSTVPNLNVAGWFDQEDFVGPMSVYGALERADEGHLDSLVVGPWNHGGWNYGKGRVLGDVDFGSDTAADFRAGEERRFFAHWLHGAPDPGLPEATVFETGTNRWRKLDAWPPKTGVTARRLFLRADHRASFEAPTEDSASDAYVSDPASPVPYRHRPIGPTYPGPEWPRWLTEDQRFVEARPDVASWKTDPLDHDVVIGGVVTAELYASTSGTDADWVVKLIDVGPEGRPGGDADGYEMMVASDIVRGRFRDSLATPTPIPAGAVVRYTVDLHTRAHAFRAGHRIMVQVQSTWFPLYDRNPQRYVDNIFLAKDSDYVKAEQRVHRSRTQPSAIVLPVVDVP